MHFKTLVAVDVPKLEENPIVDLFIEKQIELLKEKNKRNKRNILAEIDLRHLNGLRTEFARCVMALMYDKMEPYNEQTANPKFLQFEDQTEELRQEYEECTNCIKLSNGRILPENNWFFHGKFVIHEDGKVYQRHYGQLKNDKRSKKAKKMTAILNYPYKKLYKTFEEFAEIGNGFIYNEYFGGYGYTFNPKAFYDWCVIGGRWPRRFLVRNECKDYSIGDRSWGKLDIDFDAPTGYRWVAAARKKDIQWQVMRDWELECAKKDFYMYEEIYKSKIVPKDVFCQFKENKLVGYFDRLYYIEGETLESYLKRKHIVDTFKYPAITYGFLDYDGYYEEESVWKNSGTRKRVNKQKRKNRIEYRRRLDEYLESIPDESVIIGVDCHI